ncbi:hypothetical protein V6N13_020403 [Hibiscus sabdariffa]
METYSMGVYLGAPVRHLRDTSSIYDYVIDRVQRKLDGWSASTLSFAGRVTLAKIVLLSIPCYIMQPCRLPIRTCNKIESLARRFIWGSSSGSSALSLVDWSSVCQPLSNGGLGLRSLRDTNSAFLLKLCNTLIEQPDCFWVSLLRNKYHMTDVVPLVILRANCSALWHAISSLWAFYTDALEWSLGDGLTICFWTDVWVPDLGPLVTWKHQQVHIDLSIKVASLTTTDGDWNWSVLNACLLPRARARFRQLSPPQMTHGPDRCYWPAG